MNNTPIVTKIINNRYTIVIGAAGGAPSPPLHIDWFESQRQTYRGRETQQRPTTQPHTHAHGPGCFELVTKLARERSHTHTHDVHKPQECVCEFVAASARLLGNRVGHTHTVCMRSSRGIFHSTTDRVIESYQSSAVSPVSRIRCRSSGTFECTKTLSPVPIQTK